MDMIRHMIVMAHSSAVRVLHTWSACLSDKFCDKDSGVRKVVLRGNIRSVVMAQQLIMDLVWEEMETAIGVMQFMIPDEVPKDLVAM